MRANIVLIASGAQYRALEIDNLQRFLGAGIYYAATALESVVPVTPSTAITNVFRVQRRKFAFSFRNTSR